MLLCNELTLLLSTVLWCGLTALAPKNEKQHDADHNCPDWTFLNEQFHAKEVIRSWITLSKPVMLTDTNSIFALDVLYVC